MKTASRILLLIFLPFGLLLAQSGGTLEGTVTDAESGVPLSQVNIWIPGTDLGTTTDEAGHYFLRVPAAKHRIFFHHIGYSHVERTATIQSGKSTVLDVELAVQPLELRGVVIEKERNTSYLDAQYRMTTESAANIPMVAEPDIFGAIKTLPGVIQANDLTGNLYVRGGAADQNQVLLDGVEIFNPYHLFGLFSGINVWAVETFDVYPAEFPVEYTGKLSSVIDVQTKDPGEKDETIVNLSLVSSGFSLTRDLGNSALLVAGRRTYLDAITGLMGYSVPYKFYDMNLKYIYHLRENLRLRALGYLSKDEFNPGITSLQDLTESFPEVKNRWGNKAGAVQLTYREQNRIASLSVSSSENYLRMKDPNAYNVDNLMRVVELRGDAIDRHDIQVIKAGFYLKRSRLHYDWQGDYTIEQVFYPDIPTRFTYMFDEYQYGIYLQDDITLTSRLLITPGIMWDSWGERETFSPRINIKWLRQNDTRIKLSYGLYHQAFSQGAEPREGNIIAPTFPNKHPSQARSLSLSYDKALNKYFDISIDVYHRSFHDLVEIYKDDRFPAFQYGSGKTIGMDLLLKKGVGDLTYQVSGSFMRNRVTFKGAEYAPHWDTPYSLALNSTYYLTDNISLNVQTWYQSGTPYTPVIKKYLQMTGPDENSDEHNLDVTFLEGEKNSARLSDYFRFDIGVKKQGNWNTVKYEIYAQIINLFNTGNILRYNWYEYYYSKTQDGSDQSGTVTGLPIIPSVGMVVFL